ncbi:FRG domain-containing protein [Marinobacter nauticus]|uniref:FRG domain-containing protein n=1 Tax=Marinobacter nauticus TaxID=2743 RepID=UPI0015B404B6|nr:FRG domain-containing protein [Marinobacter nauticus]
MFQASGALTKTSKKKLIKLCQNIAFEDAIGAHPYVRFCAEQNFNGHPPHISFQGLAQHYGFQTDMLDVTSNFDVAAFFATSKWDKKEKRYYPVGESSFPGIIYYAEPAFYILPREDQSATFEFVGWQPLKRPAQQRAGAFRLPSGHCFSRLPGVRKAYFRHNRAASERIWQYFDGGAALFPNDEAVALSEEAQDLVYFTSSQIERAWTNLEAWERRSFSDKQKKYLFRSSGLKLIAKPPLSWDKFNLESCPDKLRMRLNSELNNVRFRQVYRPA